MSYPRLAYAGNREVGLRCLARLRRFGWEPVALLVASGAVADCTEEMKSEINPNVPVLVGAEFRSPAGVQVLSSSEIDYLVSVHFPYVIPDSVLEIPRIGALNLHPAYLPFNRGWHTPTWSLLDGTPYGATLHWMSGNIDAGDIALRKQMEVRPDDTADSLYRRVLRLEESLFAEAIPMMAESRLPSEPQAHQLATSHHKGDLAEEMFLDLDRVRLAGDVIKQLRALTTNRWDEAAFFEIGGQRFRMQIQIRPENLDNRNPEIDQ